MWNDKKIVIFGVGGVGGYFGGLLAKKNLDITFIARGETLNVLKEKGLHIESVDGDFTLYPVQVTDQPAEVGPVNIVLLCTKAPQVSEVVNQIRPLVNESTIILPLQNGVEAPTQLIEVFGKENVVGGLARIFSYKVEPGHIRHSGVSIIEMGEMDGPVSPRVKELQELLTYGGIKTIIHDNFPIALWAKMVLVCPLSGVSAVTRSTIGVIRSLPETRELLIKSMQEIIRVAQGLGVNISESLVDRIIEGIDKLPEDSMTSMQRDIMDGKPSELDFQVGSVVEYGKKLGIDVPINRFIYSCLLPLEQKARMT